MYMQEEQPSKPPFCSDKAHHRYKRKFTHHDKAEKLPHIHAVTVRRGEVLIYMHGSVVPTPTPSHEHRSDVAIRLDAPPPHPSAITNQTRAHAHTIRTDSRTQGEIRWWQGKIEVASSMSVSTFLSPLAAAASALSLSAFLRSFSSFSRSIFCAIESTRLG